MAERQHEIGPNIGCLWFDNWLLCMWIIINNEKLINACWLAQTVSEQDEAADDAHDDDDDEYVKQTKV